jgi:hypothetical protein
MGIFFSESEMARSSECRDRFAQKCLTPPTLLERRFYDSYKAGLVIKPSFALILLVVPNRLSQSPRF